jgi:hypothetical protein
MAGGSVSCASPVNYNSTTSCTVATNAGYTLTNISGCAGTPGTMSPYTTGAISAACTVTATYTLNTYALTVAKAGSGAGTVTSAPAGINCGATCSANYNYGTAITLTAAPNVGSTFTGWSGGGCTGTGTCVVTLTAATNVTATYTLSATAPTPPLIGTASAGNAQVTIAFTAPMNNGGSAITGYTATCGAQSANGTMSPITVTSLPNGTPVTCTVVATNVIGSSAPSSPSNSVTPIAPTITIQSVVSRKAHGASGNFSLPITTGIAITGAITVEPRDSRRGHTLIFDFGTPISAVGSVTVIDAAAQPIGLAYPAISGNTITVTLTGIPDNKRVTVQLSGINGFGNASVSMGFLVGDVNGSGKVNGADISAIKARASATPVTLSNYLLDLNQSGTIDAIDITMAKARAGWAIP